MPSAISFAGLLISTERLAFALAVIGVFAVTRWLTRGEPEARTHLERLGELLLLVMLVTARIGFVTLNWAAYRDAPWSTLFVWQSGYDVRFGVVGALVFFAVYFFVSNHRGQVLRFAGAVLGPMTAYLAFAIVFPFVEQNGELGYGDRMPPLSMRSLNNLAVSLKPYAGRPLIVNIWATWCVPCREEIPLLNHAANHYAQDHLNIIGVNLAQSAASVQRFKKRVTIHYPVWVDPDTGRNDKSPSALLFKQVGQVGIPTTLFVGCKGIIRHITVGKLSPGTLYREAAKIRC